MSTALNRVWTLDFVRDTLYDGCPFRTLNVIDEGNREALRIECGMPMPPSRVVCVSDQLIEMFGRPEAIRLDNGPELTTDAFVSWAERHWVKLLFIQRGKPTRARSSNASSAACVRRYWAPGRSTPSARRRPRPMIG